MTAPEPRLIHCDANILHAPGECEFCDVYGSDLQAARIEYGVNFTGHSDPGKLPCPSAAFRSAEAAHRWPGNRPQVVMHDPESGWDPATPVGWREEHNLLERLVYRLLGVPHCNNHEGKTPFGWWCSRVDSHTGPCALNRRWWNRRG